MSRRAAPPAWVAGALTAAVVSAAWRALQRVPPAAAQRWRRSNYRGRDVTLLLGPAIGVGAVAGVAVAAPSARRGAVLAVAAAAAIGGYDDLYGTRHARGLRGHARALQQGQVTTGMVKLVGLTGAAAAAAAQRDRRAVDAALSTVLIAGTANLVNLLDLRPGRAAKVTVMLAAALGRSGGRESRALAAVGAGAALVALPADLGERAMLGDCGAAALGAVLGWSAGQSGGRTRRAALAAAVIALTAASERVSFSAVIEGNAALRALDGLGRQPA